MYFQVETSCDNRKFAKELGRAIILKKLGACVQIKENVESIYSWEDQIESEKEIFNFQQFQIINPINIFVRTIENFKRKTRVLTNKIKT